MPHSKPSRTSVTSSLNRRRPAISTFSPTTTPLRSTRARAPRRISPDRGAAVLHPPQTGDLDVPAAPHPIAQPPGAGAAPDLAGPDERTRHVAELARPEDLADLGRAEAHLLELRLEHALERGLDLV